MDVVWWVALGFGAAPVAFAADPGPGIPARDGPLGPEAEPSEEIVVEGDAVAAARQAVVDSIVGLGYDKVRVKGDRSVFRQDRGWKGKIVFYDDGRVATRRRGPSPRKLEPIGGTRIRPYFLCPFAPMACIDGGSFALADRKWGHVEDAVARATAAPLVTLGDRLADEAVRVELETLPGRLDALWTAGAPLTGDGPPLPTFAARRAALYAYWDSRTETAWGLEVRAALAAFVRAVVQRSDHPFPPHERARLDAERRSAAPFPFDADDPGRSEP